MVLHFHWRGAPVIVSITKDVDQARELEELRAALLFYGMHMPVEGARARFVLRKYAGGAR